MELSALGQLAGGFGLFLLALGMMTDGLKLAAGNRLKAVLEWGTTPAWRGLASGIGITILVQSSSAVTVSAIGFVNAGLMTLPQSLAVIFGTNVGTTMTGWLVSLMGFEFKIAIFALPMVGIGMAAKLAAGRRSWGGIGWALAGFGLFFLGIDFLKSGFAGLGDNTFSVATESGVLALLISAGIGVLATVLAQSSSAAIALVLTATASGAMGLPSAAAMVIGANIGTTSTALFATIGATANAKRVAWAHVVFNLLTGAVALAVLGVAMGTVSLDDLAEDIPPVVLLAAFHTIFNILGVALIWPLKDRLAGFLEGRFRSVEEDLARPVYLDPNLAGTPSLGGMAVLQEIARIAEMTRTGIAPVLRGDAQALHCLSSRHEAVKALVVAVHRFAAALQQGELRQERSRALAECLRASHYYAEALEIAERLRDLPALLMPPGRHAAEADAGALFQACLEVVADAVPLAPDTIATPEDDSDETEAKADKERLAAIQTLYHDVRRRLFDASIIGSLNPDELGNAVEELAELNRLMKRLLKARRTYGKAAALMAQA